MVKVFFCTICARNLWILTKAWILYILLRVYLNFICECLLIFNLLIFQNFWLLLIEKISMLYVWIFILLILNMRPLNFYFRFSLYTHFAPFVTLEYLVCIDWRFSFTAVVLSRRHSSFFSWSLYLNDKFIIRSCIIATMALILCYLLWFQVCYQKIITESVFWFCSKCFPSYFVSVEHKLPILVFVLFFISISVKSLH